MRHNVEFETMWLIDSPVGPIDRLVGPNAPERGADAYCQYGPHAVHRLRFVRDAQGTGLTLTENSTIVELRNRGRAGNGGAVDRQASVTRHPPRPDSEIELRELAVVTDQKYIECGPGSRIPAHSRRVGGHPRHCDPHRIRAIVQKPGNRLDRYMALNDVVADKGSVTGRSIRRYAEFGPEAG